MWFTELGNRVGPHIAQVPLSALQAYQCIFLRQALIIHRRSELDAIHKHFDSHKQPSPCLLEALLVAEAVSVVDEVEVASAQEEVCFLTIHWCCEMLELC